MFDSSHPTRTGTLLERYLSGDRESERRLFDRHREGLLARARGARWMRGLSRVATPEDLVQETFLRALSSGMLQRFEDRGTGSLARVLEKVLGNVAVDVYRRHGSLKRGAELRDLSLGEELGREAAIAARTSDETTPTATARGRELIELCRALLPPREWEAWHLCEVQQLDGPVAAERLGVTPAAVRGLVHRARRRVLDELLRRQVDE